VTAACLSGWSATAALAADSTGVDRAAPLPPMQTSGIAPDLVAAELLMATDAEHDHAPPRRAASDALADLSAMVAAFVRAPRPINADQECLAKVIYHEAANQELKGQLAVAQVVLNRVRRSAFPKSICGVVNQRGQFFQTARYKIPVTSRRWLTAAAVAVAAQTRQLEQVVPGALFFHATYVRPHWRTQHTLVAQIGGHIFYR
jgi:spore germination cell wall hydrolase CwlJ-like protein